ncbi:MAG TPA: glycosyltransferase [Terriglobia bacterium]|nr:glycosyltransferase [Terriglobia bacterium]
MKACRYRVLVVTNLWPTEADPGYGSFVQAQMESLRPLGVDYDVVFVNGRGSRLNYLRGVFEVRDRLAAGRYDLVHAHFGLSGWVARFQARAPLVVSLMGDDVLGRFDRDGRNSLAGRLLQLSTRVLARRAAAVIVKSRQMKDRLGLPSAHVIPNGVNLSLFRPMDRNQARAMLGLDPGRKYALFPYDPAVARKRFDLVEAAVRLARPEVPELEILQVLGVPRERMPVYLNAADVLVLASYAEGSPNAVKEAMAVNLPVISVDVGDVAELIGTTEGCFLVPARAGEIAERIVEVCRGGVRTRGRDQGREWIAARYGEEAIARRIVEIYAGVTSAR